MDKCGYIVDNPIHTLEALSDKPLEQSVDTVDTKTPPFEKLKNLMMSCTTSVPAKKTPREYEVGDRVAVKDVGGLYQGARGEIVDTLYSRAGETYLIKFDKPVKNIRQSEFEGSDLMKL